MIVINYQLERATINKKDILFNLLQFALYDGSQYIENELNEDGKFSYTWFNNYFTDSDREAYFIKSGDKYLGFVMINENLKFNKLGKSIAEFLIIPQYRRNHIGKKVAMEIFNKYHGIWKNTIEEYKNNKYEMKENKVLVFKN